MSNHLGSKVDGNDFEAVEAAAKECIDWIRKNKKPAFIESMTYKLSGQYEGDTETYKSAEEVEYWKSRDPLKSYKTRILEVDSSVESLFEQFEKDNRELIVNAFAKASKDPFPTVEDMHNAVYFEEGARA